MFGAEVELRETLADQGVETAVLRVVNVLIELLSSLDPDTPVGLFLERRGPGIHHVAFEVDDFAGEV